jgi:ribose/xylose/arabinose/galactoside ABC-type transport system permease subunit
VSDIASASGVGRSRSWEALRRVAVSEHLVLWLCIGYAAAVAPFAPGFLSTGNLASILLTLIPLFVVALGQTVVLIAGGIDLSVTSTIALASVIGAMTMNAPHGWFAGHVLATPAAVLAMMLVGVVVGALNGLAVARLRMPAFIVTLTTMMFFSGFAIWLTQSRNIGGLPSSFTRLGGNVWLALGVAAATGAVVHVGLSRSLLGRWLYAMGHNARTAHVSGVPVSGVTVGAYVIGGLCAAVAAVLYTGQAEAGSPVMGQRILLDVIGATVIGGASLFGGKGKVLWTLWGVLFFKLIDNSLNLLNLSIFAITMVKGSVILGAAVLDAARQRLIAGGRA